MAKDKSAQGRASRRKGHNFEREVAKRFRALYPGTMRQLEYQQGLGVDVPAGPFDIQCKRGKQYAPITKINEIPATERIPMLVTKGDLQPTMVALRLDDFIDILKDIGAAYDYKSEDEKA